jgi:hypothetical protein
MTWPRTGGAFFEARPRTINSGEVFSNSEVPPSGRGRSSSDSHQNEPGADVDAPREAASLCEPGSR